MTARATLATNDERQGAVRRRTLARLDGVFALMPIPGAFFPMLVSGYSLGFMHRVPGRRCPESGARYPPGAHGRDLAAGWLEDRGQTLGLHRCRSRFSSARRHPGADQSPRTPWRNSSRSCRTLWRLGFTGDRSVESNRNDNCTLVVTDIGLDLCCTVDTENGPEIKCTNVLDILKPE